MIQQHSRRGFAFGISLTPSAGFARRGDGRFWLETRPVRMPWSSLRPSGKAWRTREAKTGRHDFHETEIAQRIAIRLTMPSGGRSASTSPFGFKRRASSNRRASTGYWATGAGLLGAFTRHSCARRRSARSLRDEKCKLRPALAEVVLDRIPDKQRWWRAFSWRTARDPFASGF